MSKIESVKCDKCGRFFDTGSNDFFTIYGNVCRGLEGGIIGNNLDDDMKVVRENHYCEVCFNNICFPTIVNTRDF